MVRLNSGKLALRRYLIASITTLLYSLGILECFEFKDKQYTHKSFRQYGDVQESFRKRSKVQRDLFLSRELFQNYWVPHKCLYSLEIAQATLLSLSLLEFLVMCMLP